MSSGEVSSSRVRHCDSRPCHCGSGHPSSWLRDDEGDELARVCDECRESVAFAYDRASCVDALDDADLFDQELERLDVEDEPVGEDEP